MLGSSNLLLGPQGSLPSPGSRPPAPLEYSLPEKKASGRFDLQPGELQEGRDTQWTHTGIPGSINQPATQVRKRSLSEVHKVTQRHYGLELRPLEYFTLAATPLSDGVMAVALGYIWRCTALSSLGRAPQLFLCWLWELVGRAVYAFPVWSVLPLPGSGQCSLLRALIGSPPPAHRAQDPFQEPEPGTLLGGELSSSWVLPVSIPTPRLAAPCLGQTPPPMPGTLSWPDPCGARRVPRGGQGSCQDAGWEASEAGPGAPAGPGLSPPSFLLVSTFLSCLLWLGLGLGRGGDRRDTSTCSLGKGDVIRKASWRR